MSAGTAIARNRTAKALRLVDVLIAAEATPEDLTPEVWANAEAAAGVNPASEATKAVVVELLGVERTKDALVATLHLVGSAS